MLQARYKDSIETMPKMAWRGVLIAMLTVAPVGAEVGDPTIRTSHPQYAGEGAFQEIEDCVRFATAGEKSAQDRAIALYLWMLNHQWHLMSPQEWCIPGRVPDTAVTRDYESVVYDANRARFSYGYGLCGTVHAWNEPYWQALGMQARRRSFPGHTNSEIQYDGAWHAFDTDMAGLLFRQDGVVAGYDDIVRDPSLVDSVRKPLPHYPFAWPSDFDGMKQGWKTVAAGGNWYSLYNGGYAAHPGIVHLRSGETFTRWYDRDHYGGPSQRRFWHHQAGGPRREWTFYDNGKPTHDGNQSNARGNATYCNGEFSYEPNLSLGKFREGLIAESGNAAYRDESPRLFSRDGEKCSVTFRHFSPYVICGDPVNDSNPMSEKATDGLVLAASLVGSVLLEVSADEGQSWHTVKSSGSKPIDLTEYVKGRYGWQIRLSWSDHAGIDSLRFTTITQVCQAIYPRLKASGTDVTYRTGQRGVVAVLPDLGLPEARVSAFEETSMRSANVEYRGRSEDSRRAYETTNNKPGSVVFKINSPSRLTEVRAAIRYQLRVPPPKEHDYRLDVSTDNGRTWHTFARADIPTDNEFSSGWLSGRASIEADTTSALVRFSMFAGGHRTGLMDAQLYGVYDVPSTQEISIEYGWIDSNMLRRHVETIPKGVLTRRFQVDTGPEVRDEFVRIIAK
jgi:hypothetical protein